MCRRRHRVVLLAAIATVALLAGCGTGSTKPVVVAKAVPTGAAAVDRALTTQARNLAARAKVEEQTSRNVERNRAQLVAAIRRSMRAAADRARRPAAKANGTGYSSIDVCSTVGPRGGTGAERLAQRLQERERKQRLYYLNLSCPGL